MPAIGSVTRGLRVVRFSQTMRRPGARASQQVFKREGVCNLAKGIVGRPPVPLLKHLLSALINSLEGLTRPPANLPTPSKSRSPLFAEAGKLGRAVKTIDAASTAAGTIQTPVASPPAGPSRPQRPCFLEFPPCSVDPQESTSVRPPVRLELPYIDALYSSASCDCLSRYWLEI
jgi:hypothetical protein